MKKTCAALALVVAACSYSRNAPDPEASIVRPGNFRNGSGVITAIAVVRNANQGHPDPNLYRISLLMDRTGFQEVDTDSSAFFVGQAVELTNDGRILRVSGTSLNDVIR